MDSAEVADCLQRVASGDERAANNLFHFLYPLVERLVRSHLPRRTSEEDLCQTAMVKIFSNAGQFRGKVPIEHWVSRIVINTCLKQIRAEKVRTELRIADLSEEQARVAERYASLEYVPDERDSFAARELVELMLARLRADDRLIVNLLHLEGRSIQEVAELTGWTLTAIKVKAFRARGRMRKHFNELQGPKAP